MGRKGIYLWWSHYCRTKKKKEKRGKLAGLIAPQFFTLPFPGSRAIVFIFLEHSHWSFGGGYPRSVATLAGGFSGVWVPATRRSFSTPKSPFPVQKINKPTLSPSPLTFPFFFTRHQFPPHTNAVFFFVQMGLTNFGQPYAFDATWANWFQKRAIEADDTFEAFKANYLTMSNFATGSCTAKR
jgi:hypothetical protein